MKSNLNDIKKLSASNKTKGNKRSNKTLAELHAELLALHTPKVQQINLEEVEERVKYYECLFRGEIEGHYPLREDDRELANNLLALYSNEKVLASSRAKEILEGVDEYSLMNVLAIIEYSDWQAI
jgi:hypothetical protein